MAFRPLDAGIYGLRPQDELEALIGKLQSSRAEIICLMDDGTEIALAPVGESEILEVGIPTTYTITCPVRVPNGRLFAYGNATFIFRSNDNHEESRLEL